MSPRPFVELPDNISRRTEGTLDIDLVENYFSIPSRILTLVIGCHFFSTWKVTMNDSKTKPVPPNIVGPRSGLVDDFSLEITAKDVPALLAAAPLLPSRTRINLTFLGNEDTGLRVRAASEIRALGFTPVPHIAARRLASRRELDSFLKDLSSVGAADNLVIIGGDPTHAVGPFTDSLAVITSGALAEHGVAHVDIAGYPEGHPKISDDILWRALQDKISALQRQSVSYAVATQFAFDSAAVIAWVERLRGRGIAGPVRVGVPGPAGVQRLLRYALRFGVGSSASIVQKYGFSLTNLLGTVGPTQFVADLEANTDPKTRAGLSLHFYTFGGVKATAAWVKSYRDAASVDGRTQP